MFPEWLPSKCCFRDHDSNWSVYREVVYQIFKADFITRQPKFNECWVRHDRKLHTDGKPYGFWHCISEGKIEVNRIPDFDRCERIGWIRPIIENHTKPEVDVWQNERKGQISTLLWFNEHYLVVLRHGKSGSGYPFFFLKTAYCTTEKGRIISLRDERDKYLARLQDP